MQLELLRLLCLAIAAAALLAAAVHDFRSYQIPNRFAAVIALCFLATSFGGSVREAVSGLALGTGVLAAGIVLFARRWLGGGDVKLLAAVALWVPGPLFAAFAMVTSFAGAALALVMMTPLHRHFPAPPAAAFSGGAATAGRLRQPMPFGIAIAIGGLFILCTRLPG
jgi:prepilin peptidase CpaA